MRNVTINDNIPLIIGISLIRPKKIYNEYLCHIKNTLVLVCQKTLKDFLTSSIVHKSSMTTA